MLSEIFSFGIFAIFSLALLCLFNSIARPKILKIIICLLWLIGNYYAICSLIQILYIESYKLKRELLIEFLNQIIYSDYHFFAINFAIFSYIQTYYIHYSVVNRADLMILANIQFIVFLLKIEDQIIKDSIAWIAYEFFLVIYLMKNNYIWGYSSINYFFTIYFTNSFLLYFGIRPSIIAISGFMIETAYKYALLLLAAIFFIYANIFVLVIVYNPQANAKRSLKQIFRSYDKTEFFISRELLPICFFISIFISINLYRLLVLYTLEELPLILSLLESLGYSFLLAMMMLFSEGDFLGANIYFNIFSIGFSIHLLSYWL